MTASAKLSLSTGGDHLVVNLGSHTVRIPVPASAYSASDEARKTLVRLVSNMEAGKAKPTLLQMQELLTQVRIANKALAGVTLLSSILLARELDPDALLNSRAVPTQALVDAFLKNGGKVEDEAERNERKFEEKYGVKTDDLLKLMGEDVL